MASTDEDYYPTTNVGGDGDCPKYDINYMDSGGEVHRFDLDIPLEAAGDLAAVLNKQKNKRNKK